MATVKKPSTKSPVTKKASARKKVELKLDGSDVVHGAQELLDTAGEKLQEIAQKPQVKQVVKSVKKGVNDLQKNPDVKRVVKQAQDVAAQATQKVKDVVEDTTSRSDVREVRENIQVKGGQLLEKARELIKQGNVRRIIIKDKNGKSIAEFPLTVGVIGAAATFPLVAIGTIAALITECTITVVREK